MKHKKIKESILAVLGDVTTGACPDCCETLDDLQLGCDTCYPLKKVLWGKKYHS